MSIGPEHSVTRRGEGGASGPFPGGKRTGRFIAAAGRALLSVNLSDRRWTDNR